MDYKELFKSSISPFKEIVAYESLWMDKTASFKRLAELFSKFPNKTPSEIAETSISSQLLFNEIGEIIKKIRHDFNFSIIINNTFDYPDKLKDAKERIEMFYYAGDSSLLKERSVAIVGTRNPSPEGLKRTQKLTKKLVQDNFTVVSGLATGIDTMAHTTAIEEKGKTIAVIGTPINEVYPKSNADLQRRICKEHLLISQVPIFRYSKQGINGNRLFFPERNKTMSALTEATVIVEASDTSGTLVQAKAALAQGRKLFILDSCFQNKSINWPEKYLSQGAIRVRAYEDIINVLGK